VIHIQTLKNASEFESVRPLWEQLASRPEATVFQQYHWNRLAAEIFADREQPHVLVATRDDHAVILPLAIRTNGTACLLGETLFDYRDMLSTGDAELELAVLAEASSLGLPLEITALTPQAARCWTLFESKQFAKAPRIKRSECSAKQLMEAHRRLGRHSRRIAARGAHLKHRSGTDREFIRELYVRKAAQAGSLFTDPVRREFMERICLEEGGGCQIFTYETASELVSVILTFRSDHARCFYTVYYDLAWKAFSPGQVLLYESSLQTLSDNLDCDFMTGEYPYKMRLANDAVPLVRIETSAKEWREALDRRIAKIAA
jgi:CelD/BcsL family acetyltransferase involved in cellulose biosynthesis